MKRISNFPHYYVSRDGNVYSDYSGKIKRIKPWVDSKNLYLLVTLCENKKRHRALVHRLVAQAFVPNPRNLPEVHHKDKNPANAKAENLEWTTRAANLEESYKTMPPTRNFIPCTLVANGVFKMDFNGIHPAAKFAEEKYGCSAAMLEKYHKHKTCEIVCKV